MIRHREVNAFTQILIMALLLATTLPALNAEVYKTSIRPHWFADGAKFW